MRISCARPKELDSRGWAPRSEADGVAYARGNLAVNQQGLAPSRSVAGRGCNRTTSASESSVDAVRFQRYESGNLHFMGALEAASRAMWKRWNRARVFCQRKTRRVVLKVAILLSAGAFVASAPAQVATQPRTSFAP